MRSWTRRQDCHLLAPLPLGLTANRPRARPAAAAAAASDSLISGGRSHPSDASIWCRLRSALLTRNSLSLIGRSSLSFHALARSRSISTAAVTGVERGRAHGCVARQKTTPRGPRPRGALPLHRHRNAKRKTKNARPCACGRQRRALQAGDTQAHLMPWPARRSETRPASSRTRAPKQA